jgi:hypothetical protein
MTQFPPDVLKEANRAGRLAGNSSVNLITRAVTIDGDRCR